MTRPPRRPFRDHKRDAKYPHTIRQSLTREDRMARIAARFPAVDLQRAIVERFRGTRSIVGLQIAFSEDGLADVVRSLCRDCAAEIKADLAQDARDEAFAKEAAK